MSAIKKVSRISCASEECDFNVVMIGAGGTGAKSAVTIKYVFDRFLEEYDPTIEDSYGMSITIDGQPFKMCIIGMFFSLSFNHCIISLCLDAPF